MSSMRALLLGFCVLFLIMPAWADLSDDDVLRLVNSGRDAAVQVKKGDVRIQRPAAYPNVILVGYLTGTRGCLLGTVIVDGKAYVVNQAAAVVLGARGWSSATPDDRCQLARTWVESVMLAFGESILNERPADFPPQSRGGKFIKPDLRMTGNGGVQLTTWIHEDSGPTSGNNYRRSYYLFGPNGELLRVKVLDRIDTDGT